MSDIIPRRKAVPVQARRAEVPPETIQIPGAAPISIPPQAGVTQNIIYVNVPAQPPPPPQSPATPSEIHFHNTNIYEAPRRKRRVIGTSFFGLWALVFAGVAAGMAYVPWVMWLARPVAEIGAVCAVVGLLGAVLLRRVGWGVPMFALLMCGVAYCMWLNNSGQLSGPKLDLGGKPTDPARVLNPPETTPLTIAPNPPAQDPTRLHDQSIFGDGSGTWVKSTPGPTAPAPTLAPPHPTPAIDVATATANLQRARTAAAAKLRVDYTGAKTAADAATAEYQDAKIAFSPGSPELIAASQKHLEADSRLNVIEMKLRADPEVAAAEAALKTAK
jgi:hypothetical protein